MDFSTQASISLPPEHIPATVSSVKTAPGNTVHKDQVLFTYFYYAQPQQDSNKPPRKMVAELRSPLKAIIIDLAVKQGDVIDNSR